MKESTELRATRMIYVGSFLISTLLLIVLSLKQPLRSNIAAGYLFGAALVFGAIIIGTLRGARHGLLRLFLILAVLNIVIVPPELFLRLRGFRYESGIQFGYPRPYQFDVFEPDAKLFWKFPPSRPGVNAYGFEGPQVVRPKPAGVYRIVFLGNSCTYQGFPGMVELILGGANPEVECLNFANPGYTSYQGKVIARDYLRELEPNLLVVSYGWNDRWLAYGSPDESKRIFVSKSRGSSLFSDIYARWRLLQYCRKALSPALGRANEPLDVPRVPLDQFSANLRAIAGTADSLGIPVIFATEPSAYPTLGVPEYVVQSKYAKSKEASLGLFREYNDAVRHVAREGNTWHLIDLDALMSSRPEVRKLFMDDGIHYSRSGMAVVADIEARYISEHFLAPRGKKR
jgi:lysophospholipase L1-like esterase